MRWTQIWNLQHLKYFHSSAMYVIEETVICLGHYTCLGQNRKKFKKTKTEKRWEKSEYFFVEKWDLNRSWVDSDETKEKDTSWY